MVGRKGGDVDERGNGFPLFEILFKDWSSGQVTKNLVVNYIPQHLPTSYEQ